MEEKGRHFLLHLLKFVFGVAGRVKLPSDIQCLLDGYPPNEKSPFSGNIVSALIHFIAYYIQHSDDLSEIGSQEFKHGLKSIVTSADFLEFVGSYSVKALYEYSNGNQSSPSLFLEQVTDFLKHVSIEEGSVAHFLETWNQAAEKILREAGGRNFPRRFDPNIVVDLERERAFLIELMNWVFGIYGARKEIKLQRESEHVPLLIGMKACLKMIEYHHEQFLSICDHEQLEDYFHKRCVQRFYFRDFMELCVCCVANAKFKNSSLQTSENACDFLLAHIETGIRDDAYVSFYETPLIEVENLAYTLSKIHDPESCYV